MARSPRSRAPAPRVSQLEFGPNLPCFRACTFDDTINTLPAGGAETALLFDNWENGNENVFSPNFTGSPALLSSVSALVEGVFALTAQLKLSASLAAAENIGITFEEGGQDTEAPSGVYAGQPLAGDNSGGLYTVTFVKGYPPVWLRALASTCALAPCLAEWRVNAAQNSAADKDVTVAAFEIYLIGGLSVDTSELGP